MTELKESELLNIIRLKFAKVEPLAYNYQRDRLLFHCSLGWVVLNLKTKEYKSLSDNEAFALNRAWVQQVINLV